MPPMPPGPSTVRVLCLSLLALLALLALPAAAPAATASPQLSAAHGQGGPPRGWSVAPSGGGRPSFYAEGMPGTVLQDTVSVTNRGTEPVTVRLRGTGVPITFARPEVRVPARTRADVPFTVTVPTAAAPGDRPGAVTARGTDGREATVRLRLRVGGPALAALTVEHVAVRGGRITYELVNRGTTILAPRLAVHAEGVFGTVLDRAPRPLSVVLSPGRRIQLSEPWPDRPALDAVAVRLTVTAVGGAHDTADASAWFVPWGSVATGAGAAGAAAAGGALSVVRRRRRRTTNSGDVGEGPYEQVELTGAVT
ncbi:hypothetical protein ABZV31_23590 [Streptomyces sp. NPDC005202]|uniref:COG1470 family protein n=1 Tax=Streptomyces sp. NPDC005202 TaxID=3157021 RepID=UPI0033ACFAE6